MARTARSGIRTQPETGTGEEASEIEASVNEVRLVGRLAGAPIERVLPSGTILLTFRVVVRRAGDQPPRTEGARVPTVDTVDCVAWQPRVRRIVNGWQVSDVVAVEGSLRRRFWRGASGLASRYEVQVSSGRRLRTAQP
jgi:single-strand DNA-binding protein